MNNKNMDFSFRKFIRLVNKEFNPITYLHFYSIIFVFLNLNLPAQQLSTTIKKIPDDAIFGQNEEHINNFKGTIYYLPDHTIKMPQFTELKPIGEIYTNVLNVEKQDFDKGFPGVSNRFEDFAIDYKGQFYIHDSCYYCFLLGSDDGSKLFIDENLIIDNDFQHELYYKTNCVELKKGVHKIEVQYFQGPRYCVALVLKYKKIEEKPYQVFNLSKFYPIDVEDKGTSIDISIGSEILFDFNSFELSEVAKQALGEIKRVIIDKLKIKSIIIEGHTDDIGGEEYNMKLSINRADAVKKFYTNIGIESETIITKGCGKLKPKVPNINDENRRKNRRIEITIIKW
jgi:outer membrane protein OmpA-like peptidoglycan-associated protein